MAKDVKHQNHTDQHRATSEPPDRPTGPLSIPVSPEDRDVVKVNNANLTELKNACDDAVKRVRSFHPIFIYLDLNSNPFFHSIVKLLTHKMNE